MIQIEELKKTNIKQLKKENEDMLVNKCIISIANLK